MKPQLEDIQPPLIEQLTAFIEEALPINYEARQYIEELSGEEQNKLFEEAAAEVPEFADGQLMRMHILGSIAAGDIRLIGTLSGLPAVRSAGSRIGQAVIANTPGSHTRASLGRWLASDER